MDFNQKMHHLVDENFNEMVAAIQKFVRMDSVLEEDKMTSEDPFGKKLTIVLNEFLNYGKSKGFDVKNIENSAGYLECGKGSSSIGILGHLDVVPTGKKELWTDDPFSGTIRDNKLYGRGSIDDKGPTISAMYALYALKNCGVKLNKTYRVIVGLDEESGSRCIKKYLEHEPNPDFSFSPDAQFPVINAEKGIFRFDFLDSYNPDKTEIYIESIESGDRYNIVPEEAKAYICGDIDQAEKMIKPHLNEHCTLTRENSKLVLTTKGVAVHAKNPAIGRNALLLLMQVLTSANMPGELGQIIKKYNKVLKNESYGESLGVACSDEISGRLTVNTAAMSAKDGKVRIKFDIRYPVTVQGSDITKKLTATAEKIDSELKVMQDKAPLYLPADMPFIKTLLNVYNEFTQTEGKPISIGGGTYCRFLENAASFGAVFPGEEELAHQPNEYINLDSLRKATHIYAEALYRLNG